MISERIDLGPGLSISRVITGMWQIADLERDGKERDPRDMARFMTAYEEAGLTSYDMADHYGAAEIISGIFGKEFAKSPFQFMTKWVPAPGPVTRSMVREAVEQAIIRLQIDRLDMMQFHAWNYADPRWLDGLFFLDELRKEGLISHLGVTNFDTAHLRIALTSGIRIVSNQVCYSLLDQRAAGPLTALCKEFDVQLLAFGTLAGGFLTEKWIGKPEPDADKLKTWSEMKYMRFIDAAGGWAKFQDLLLVLEKVAHRHKTSMANVASRFVLDRPCVAAIIIGARLGASSHLEDTLGLFKLSLTPQDQDEILKGIETLLPIPGDSGDEYRKPPFLTASGDLSHHIESMPAPFPVTTVADGRSKALSGTVWEDLAGFSRAVRKGNHIFISGTTATHGVMPIGGNDAAAQTHFIIDKIAGAIQSLGGKIEDVVRTRIYVRNVSDWEVIARAHGERFKDIQPANTMVQAELIGSPYLVEIDAEAIL